MDLSAAVHPIVTANQATPKGRKLYLEIDGLKHELFFDEDLIIVERLEKKIRAEIGWFEKISNHPPSVGAFYESLIQQAVSEALPSNAKLGTGFIYDSERRKVSPQIDLLTYYDYQRAPIYRNKEFVVVDSSCSISCIEVKKTITLAILRRTVNSYLNENLGTSPHSHEGVQFLNIFAFNSKVSIDKAFECLARELESFSKNFETKTKNGDTVIFGTHNIVLPNLFFFDRTGYIRSYLIPNNDNVSFRVELSLNRSSQAGHSLGEFLEFVTRTDRNDNYDFSKNFLAYPLVQPEKQVVVWDKLVLMKRLSTQDLVKKFPNEISLIMGIKTKPYGAIVPSACDLEKMKLIDLVQQPFFKWLNNQNFDY